MTTTVDYLVFLCRATDVQPQPEVITRLAGVLDGPTVTAMIDLMQKKDMQAVFFEFAMQSLTPSERTALDWVAQKVFVSSREVGDEFGIQASTSVNRLRALERKGVLVGAFEWLPAGGGSRKYYRVANGPLDPSAVAQFVPGLGDGRAR